MFRFLSNMIFILILFLLVTAMPLSKDVLTINLFQPVIESPAEEPNIATTYHLKSHFDSIDYTPDSIEFSIESTPYKFAEPLLAEMEVKLYDSDQLINTSKLSDLSPHIENADASSDKVAFSMQSIIDSLKPNQYKIVIDGPVFEESLTAILSNEKFDKKALTALETAENGKLTMSLYYPTDDYKLLIPVSRVVASPSNRSRATLKELDKGPSSVLGLLQGDAIWPYASKLAIKGGDASVYIYSPEYSGFEDKFQVAVDAITQTLASLDFVDKANFYIDNSKSKPFGGVDLTKTYMPRRENLAYLSYNKGSDYMLLIPLKLEELSPEFTGTEEIAEQARLLFKVLQSPQIGEAYTSSQAYINSTVPKDVTLEQVGYDGGTLILGFNQAFSKAYNGHSEYIRQMMLSLSKSFNSLASVESVIITINGEVISDYYGYNLAEPLPNPEFINLEP